MASMTGELSMLNIGCRILNIRSWSNRTRSSRTSIAILPTARNWIQPSTDTKPLATSTPTLPPNSNKAYGLTMVQSNTLGLPFSSIICKYTSQGDSQWVLWALLLPRELRVRARPHLPSMCSFLFMNDQLCGSETRMQENSTTHRLCGLYLIKTREHKR